MTYHDDQGNWNPYAPPAGPTPYMPSPPPYMPSPPPAKSGKGWKALAVIVIATAIVAAGAIIAHRPFNSPATTAPASTVTTDTTRVAATTVTPGGGDNQFDALIQANNPSLVGRLNGNLAGAERVGRAVCSELDAGTSIATVLSEGTKAVQGTVLTAGDAGALMGAGVVAYCPTYLPQARAWLSANGY